MHRSLSKFVVILLCFALTLGTFVQHKAEAANSQPGDQNSAVPNSPVTGAAYGNGTYVAVGYYGNIFKSTDGLNWQTAIDAAQLNTTYTGVAFGNGIFVAVGYDGVIMTSADGTTWTQQRSPTTNIIAKVAYVGINGINKFYAVTKAGSILSSADGTAWTSSVLPGSNGADLTSIAANNSYVVIGDSTGTVHSSSNGTSWSHSKQPGAFFINSVLSLGNRFYTNEVLTGTYMTTDFTRWDNVPLGGQVFGGLYDGMKYYLFGYGGSSYGAVYTSTDGTSFGVQAKKSTMTVQNGFYANGVYLQLGNDGMVASTDGINWNHTYGGTFSGTAYNGSKFYAVGGYGSDGFMRVSSDFSNWSPINLPLASALKGIAYGNGKYVAVGGSPGIVLTSSDGTSWLPTAATVSRYALNAVAYGNNTFIAVDTIGSIYQSTDNGLNWTKVRSDVDYNALRSVTYANGKFYAVGDSLDGAGTYLESADNGANWQATSPSPFVAKFNKYVPAQADVAVTLDLHGASLAGASVSNWGAALQPGTDYIAAGSTITINKGFLAQLANGWQLIAFHLSDGTTQTVAVLVSNNAPALASVTSALSGVGVAAWSFASGASRYELQLYRNGAVWGPAVSAATSDLNKDFQPSMRAGGPADYTLKVTAKGDTVHYADGPQSAASTVSTLYSAPAEDGTANKAGTSQNANFNIVVNAVTGAKVTAKVNGATVLQNAATDVTATGGKATLPIALTKLSESPNNMIIAFTTTTGFSEDLKVQVTKDTTPPATPTEDGTDNKANTLQNADFNIVVNAEPDSKVTAQVNGASVLKTVTSVTAASGKAALPIDSTKLQEGVNPITIVSTDAATNNSNALTVPVTRDTVAPVQPSEDGSADKAGTTQNADFNIVVNAETSSTVTAKVNGTNVLKTVTSVTAASSKATLPINVASLNENGNDIVIVATDAAGNASNPLTVHVIKDTTAPSAPAEDGTADKAGTAQNLDFDIVVTAETGSVVTAQVNGTNVLQAGSAVTAAGGKATLPIALASLTEGANDILIVATDAVGNISTPLHVSVVKDTTSPDKPAEDGTADKAGTKQNADFAIRVTAETGSTVTAQVNGANVLKSGSSVTAIGGKATLLIDLSKLVEAANDIVIVTTDSTGNASNALTVQVTKDTIVPNKPAEDGSADKNNTVQSADFTITVNAETGSVVTAQVNGTNVLQTVTSVTAAGGKAALPIHMASLSEAGNDIKIVATDAAGNASDALIVHVTKDTTAPNTPAEDGTANKAGTTQNANFTIAVTAADGDVLTATVNGANVLQSVTSVVASSGKAVLPIDISLLQAQNDIEIVAADNVGNKSNALTVHVTKDIDAPAAPAEDGTADKAGTTQHVNFSIIVTAENDAKLIATVNGANVLDSATSVTAAGGKATLPIDLTKLAEAGNDIEIVATDAAGNASNKLTVHVTKDTTPPSLPMEDGTDNKAGTSQRVNFDILLTVEDGATLTAKVNGTNALQSVTSVTAAGGKATLPIDITKLAFGSNGITITASDAVGNVSPTLVVPVTRLASSNADLSQLLVSAGSVVPAFDPSVQNYTVSVANSTDTIQITPTTADAGATLKVNDEAVISGHSSSPIQLQVGSNVISVAVTAADSTTKTYSVTVIRVSNNALLANVFADQGTLTPVFNTTQLQYSLDVTNPITSVNLYMSKADSQATLTVTGAVYSTVTGGVYAYTVPSLAVGANPVDIQVTAQDGTANHYQILVNRAPNPNGNANLSGLTLSSGVLNPVFAPGQNVYSSYVDYSVSSLTVTGNVYDSGATMTVNGVSMASGQPSAPIQLQVGTNIVTIVVTAQNGEDLTYTVSVLRDRRESHDSGSGSYTSAPPANPTEGTLEIPPGKEGSAHLNHEVTVTIPAGATNQELRLSITKLSEQIAGQLVTDKEDLVSSVFELLKNFPDKFSKQITLTFAFDPELVKNGQKPAVYYYDEAKKQWVEIGGVVNGESITVQVDHFTKFAVFAKDQPSGDQNPAPHLGDIAGHWAEARIQQAVSLGIVSGYPNGTFQPDHSVTRAEFAVMLMNVLKGQDAGMELSFTDKSDIGAWAQQAVAQAVKAGFIKGYEDGTFRPQAEITRAEMAAMLAGALGYKGNANATSGFADDADIPAWAKGSIAYVKQAGLIQGKGENTFAPQDHATRAEAVTVLLSLSQMSK